MHRRALSTILKASQPLRSALRFRSLAVLNNNTPCSLRNLTYSPRNYFTSTSSPSDVALLEEVEAKVFQVLGSAAKCKHDKLTRTATFQQLGFDSLDSVELVVAMQEFFGFDISNEDAEKINNVQTAINVFFKYMNDKIANKLAQPADSDIKKQ